MKLTLNEKKQTNALVRKQQEYVSSRFESAHKREWIEGLLKVEES